MGDKNILTTCVNGDGKCIVSQKLPKSKDQKEDFIIIRKNPII